MKKYKKITAVFLSLAMTAGICGCAGELEDTPQGQPDAEESVDSTGENGNSSQADTG